MHQTCCAKHVTSNVCIKQHRTIETTERDADVDSDKSDAKVTGDLNKLLRRIIKSGVEIENL